MAAESEAAIASVFPKEMSLFARVNANAVTGNVMGMPPKKMHSALLRSSDHFGNSAFVYGS